MPSFCDSFVQTHILMATAVARLALLVLMWLREANLLKDYSILKQQSLVGGRIEINNHSARHCTLVNELKELAECTQIQMRRVLRYFIKDDLPIHVTVVVNGSGANRQSAAGVLCVLSNKCRT